MKYVLKYLYLNVVSLVLSSGVWAQQVLLPAQSCQNHAGSDIVSFADSVLEDEVRKALSIPQQETLT